MKYLILAALLPAVAFAQSGPPVSPFPWEYRSAPAVEPLEAFRQQRALAEIIASQQTLKAAQTEALIQQATQARIQNKILAGEQPLPSQYEELTSRILMGLRDPRTGR